MHIVRPATVQNDRPRGQGSSTGSNSPVAKDCAGCHRAITERYMLQTMDQIWHEDCLKCSCCDCRLGEVGSTLYYKADLFLCRRDYLRLFGATGVCAVCCKVIPAFEMVMKSKSNVYHLDCFACQQCNHRFCIGDRYYLCDNRILCELDYENRLTRQNMSFSSPQRPLSQKLAPISASNLLPGVNSTTGNNLITGAKHSGHEEGMERLGDCVSDKNQMTTMSTNGL